MAKITYEDVVRECAEKGWTVITPSYTNLKTPMSFKCKNGHAVTETWAKVRASYTCPECKKDLRHKVLWNTDHSKAEDVYRVLALDQATHTTGYSIFDDGELVAFGIYIASGSNGLLRLMDNCDWLERMIDDWQPDFFGLEDIQYNPYGGQGHNTFKLLGQLMGALARTAWLKGLDAHAAHIPSWRSHCGIRGKKRDELKRNTQAYVKRRFGLSVTEDEADAICIGKYFSEVKK